MAVKPSKLRRRARALPAGVLSHCTICLEEQLYSQGLSLLTNSLTSGTDTNAPACVPPPQHLAVLATLVAQPRLTTRTFDRDRHAAADDALRYLRLVADTVDINESRLSDALKFEDTTVGRRGSARARTRKSDTIGGDDDDDEMKSITSIYTGKQALWTNAQDFWAILGWALNCSIRHNARWERWKLWLDLVLDILQADLEAACAVSKSEQEEKMRETLIAKYLSTIGEGRNNKRRIMRAVTADGSSKSMAEFGEIWKGETKPPKKEVDDERLSKSLKLDIDNDEFGDYFDEEEEEHSQELKKRQSQWSGGRLTKLDPANNGDDIDELDEIGQYGGMESIQLRQRVLALLTRFSRVAPSLFMDAEDLFEIFTEFLRPLPLLVYQQFILPIKPYFKDPEPQVALDLQVALNEMMLQPLLGLQETTSYTTQADFEARFAPALATNSTAIDNAKVSLLVESMLRALWKASQLGGDVDSLFREVESGIKAREDKVAWAAHKKTSKKLDIDKQARTVLEESGQRMKMLVEMIAA